MDIARFKTENGGQFAEKSIFLIVLCTATKMFFPKRFKKKLIQIS